MTTLTHANVSGTYAAPQSILARGKTNAAQFAVAGTLEVATTDIDSGDIIHLCNIPWDAKVQKIWLFNDDLATHSTPTLAADIGLYSVDRAGTFTVDDIDAYASAVVLPITTAGHYLAFDDMALSTARARAIDTKITATWTGTATTGGFEVVIAYLPNR